ncbi:MAG: cadmium-translocating P-type ATPase, partial [Firmicutes bacterium]|nr:cadmium-translocating P-type ATPase [Bacillota bacterium]
ITKGRVFDENFLMSIATIGAFILGEYAEALAVMVFYQTGEFLQDLAVEHSRKSITGLMDLKIEHADLVKDGEIKQIDPEDIAVGDVLLVKQGAKVPVDGVICDGITSFDTSALTGESVPLGANVGDKVLSGYINCGKAVKVRAESTYENCTAARILEMTENAAAHKAKAENFISAFAAVYTPVVVVLAVALAVLPCLIYGFDPKWIKRGLIFLVASCPCALVLSVPLCFFSGIGKASKLGVLIKGSSYIQTLNKIKTVVFDKTGTLTTGEFEVKSANDETLALAAALEQYSTHPVAKAITSAYGKTPEEVSDVNEVSGYGITAVYRGKNAAVGSRAFMQKLGIPLDGTDADVYAALDGNLTGGITLSDTVKPDCETTVLALSAIGIKSAMFTGDTKQNAMETAKKAGISHVEYELLPGDKLEKLNALRKKYGAAAFVGDGINDAPVLAGADVGAAMGGIGSDAAIEAADVVIMGDKTSGILRAVEVSRKTMAILKQNVAFVLIVKLAVLALAALGFGNMWLAVFADVGTALIAVVNSLRILR